MHAVKVELKNDLACVIIDHPPVNITSTAVCHRSPKATAKTRDTRLAIRQNNAHPFVAAVRGTVLVGLLEIAIGSATPIAPTETFLRSV